MSHEVLLTGFGVRTAFGTGADALREGVFDGRPAFAPITRFDPGPYRTNVAAASGAAAPLRDVLAEVAGAAAGMAGLRPGTEATVLVGTAGDFTALTHFWRATASRDGTVSLGAPGGGASPGARGGTPSPGERGGGASP
ncbi:beta-ketoacyl-[acyl-carrier-protein] synthase family protein, partial [Streptomyces botrytidirepellens]